MKNSTPKIAGLGIALFTLTLSVARANAAELQQVAPGDIPRGAMFFFSTHLDPGTFWPPTPFNPYTECPVFLLDLTNRIFLVDDSQREFTGRFAMENNFPMPGDGGGTNGPSDYIPIVPIVYSTNDLWLQIVQKTNTTGLFVVHPLWNETSNSFDLFATRNLTHDGPGLNATNWTWLFRNLGGVTNFAVSNLTDEVCFFRLGWTNDTDGDGLSDAMELIWSHSDPSSNDQNTNGIPDGWEWFHFGNLDQTAGGDYDSDGLDNGTEYTNSTDPNTIAFWITATNVYVRTQFPFVQLDVSNGVPSSMAVLIDSTNFADATWTTYSSHPAIDLGTTEGWHHVSIGLRGRLVT